MKVFFVLFSLLTAQLVAYPHFAEKTKGTPLITPQKHIEYIKSTGRYPLKLPPQLLIICYNERHLQKILNEHPTTPCDGSFSKVYFIDDHPGVACAYFGVGAPLNAMKMELMIAWGVKKFISLGSAGCLRKDLAIGDIIVCEKAIRDEGTSYHYVPYTKYAYPTEGMKNKLSQALRSLNIPFQNGTSWTTDTFYCQTEEEVKHYQKEGVSCVEMEASALFCVASLYKDVEIAAFFTISDTYADFEWKPNFRNPKIDQGFHNLFRAALLATRL